MFFGIFVTLSKVKRHELNTGLVGYSNGKNVSDPLMVWFLKWHP